MQISLTIDSLFSTGLITFLENDGKGEKGNERESYLLLTERG